MDRTVATGTGFIGQYRPPVARQYEDLNSCPDELLLFMHHLPYSYQLHSGKTIIQHIYDTHYQGVEGIEKFVQQWRALKSKIDEQRYQEVLAKLNYQAGHARVWRDAVCNWFRKQSGIDDALGRVGHYPGRLEAENLILKGYEVVEVKPWETASGGKAVVCSSTTETCSTSYHFKGNPGWYTLAIQYFDLNTGAAQFQVKVAGQKVDEWVANDNLPTGECNGHSSIRRTIAGIALRPGDEIVVEGFPQSNEKAPWDYLEIIPQIAGEEK
jgi:alpha-glucuronidase